MKDNLRITQLVTRPRIRQIVHRNRRSNLLNLLSLLYHFQTTRPWFSNIAPHNYRRFSFRLLKLRNIVLTDYNSGFLLQGISHNKGILFPIKRGYIQNE